VVKKVKYEQVFQVWWTL